MPISTKQLNFCDVSTDFDYKIYQNQDDLLSLLNLFININDFIPFLSKILITDTTEIGAYVTENTPKFY